MSELYGVVIQPITDDTTPANVERYGEVVDLDNLMSKDDRGRDFCDGQTSALPPEYADDQAGMIYTYDRRTAETFSGIVRDDLAARITSGQVIATPSWMVNPVAVSVLSAETLPIVVGELRDAGAISTVITDSQIQTQIQAYVTSTGMANPTTAELLEWIAEHAGWAQ